VCGRGGFFSRGGTPPPPPHAPAGAVQNKITDAAGAEKMTFQAALGHACGTGFKAADHLAKYKDFAWQRDILRDMPARGWAKFSAK
jgi:hypothetical protein